jgi:tetratricopeptide (TPR) repeat protein/mono/diheme cytochrome c family protein
LLLSCVCFTGAGCEPAGPVAVEQPLASTASITFNRDIAPIVYARCATCHRPGEAAPFSLLTYHDVAAHREQIVEVTQNGYMPPWPPAPGHLPFRNERRLTPGELDQLTAWVATGAMEGKPDDLPPQPQWVDGWQLGEPDLVLGMDRPYEMEAGGSDVFRNFVIPVELPSDRYVAAYEFRAGNARVVHHADIRVDVTGGMRELDALDEAPGFEGIFGGSGLSPGGVFLGWTPGRVPHPPDPQIAWPLRDGVDLIFQLHLQPTGKPESIQSSIGLYFAEEPPAKLSYALSIGRRFFDIPPGAQDYTVEQSYTLPVDAHALSVYPHAHFLARHVHGWVTFPDGTQTTLIEIKDWDFNWQDQYAYHDPLFLPAGCRIHMRYTYDNSAQNPRNPSHPPQRVVYGPRSINEMGELMLQLVLENREDFQRLDADNGQFQFRSMIDDFEKALAIEPDNVIFLHELGSLHAEVSQSEEAARYFLREIELREDGPDKAKALMHLALAYHQRGMAPETEDSLRKAAQMEPRLARAWFALGDLLNGQGRISEALSTYQQGLQRDPQNLKILAKVGILYLHQKNLAQATATYRQILKLEPKHFDAQFNLGNLLLMQGQAASAIEHYQAALELRPDVAQAHKQLGIVYAIQRDFERAGDAFEEALRLDDQLADAHYNLAMVREEQGRDADAARHYRRRLEDPSGSVTAAVKLAWILATSPDQSVRDPQEAVRLAREGAQATDRQEPVVLDRLAAAEAAAGNFQAAVAIAREASDIARQLGKQQLAAQIDARLELYREGRPYFRRAASPPLD